MTGTSTDGANDRAGAPWRSAAALALCVLVAVTLLDAIERLTDDRIATARAARLADTLAEVLPDTAFDNDPAADRRQIRAQALGGDALVPIYPLRLGDRVIGAVLGVVAPDGYGGPIELLVGVDASGRVAAVRVTGHRETPGLGDRIERRRSSWIARFDGRALDVDAPRAWRVVRGVSGADGGGRRGGEFDALTGATITSRAVVDAVRRALVWFEANRATVFSEERR